MSNIGYGWLFIAYTVGLVPVSMLWYRVGYSMGVEHSHTDGNDTP